MSPFDIKPKKLKRKMGEVCSLKNFADYVTIFNLSPMQHLRWSSLWQKLGNGWKMLLTAVAYNFVIIVTGFLDPTLKCIDLDQGNRIFHLPLTCSNSAKIIHQSNMSQSTIRTPEQRLVFLFNFVYWTSTLNRFHILSYN